MKQVDRKPSKDEEEEEPNPTSHFSVAGPLSLWIGLVAIAAIIQLFVFPAMQSAIVTPGLAYINHIAAYALYITGVFVLPVLAGLWIGARAGSTKGKMGAISYRAAINAIYVSVVYLIEMFIFYIISSTTHTSILSALSIGPFIEYVVVLPILICVVVAPLFAMVSAARRY